MQTQVVEPKKNGRPLAIDQPVVQKLIEALKLGSTVEEACLYAKIAKPTFYDQIKRDESFAYEIEVARAYPQLIAKRRLIRAMKSEQDTDAAKWWLERRQPELFATKATAGAGQINVIIRPGGYMPPIIDAQIEEDKTDSGSK